VSILRQRFSGSSGHSNPSGSVTFKDGSTILGTSALTSGQAVYSTTTFGVSSHSINAFYDGDINFSASNTMITQVVNKALPVITWNNPVDILYGTALSGVQLNATASVPGSFVYNPANGVVLSAGASQTLNVTFTPTDTTNYNTATASVHINVIKR